MIPEPDDLPLDVLLRLALREVEDDGDAPMPSLVALHRRSTREVFERAVALAGHRDSARRELGVLILREFPAFAAETVVLLRERLAVEIEPVVTRWIVSGLGRHSARVALPQVVALADHPDERVRFHVAAALPSLVDLDRVEPEAVEALVRLCHDADADTRYYALYAATREIAGLDVGLVTRLTAALADDPDDQVRSMATRHHEAIHEVRRMIADDSLIGPVLVTLACEGDAAMLAELLRRHLDPAAADALAERLVTWWTDRESRVVWA
ncbi:HEAT repeat domain-containing protein [Actinoplanes couchii]|uniref:PBS lyase HEAT domain protein repeat-containing protein n=1 Tax=Actinoplanes couchii TaxID=403638 RepID=A0ABQ3XI71_9ACTN|nr:HEAT repeat domain-containing protein [Actinoplanes couchii]MDR6317726.1 hypothetical protein [Actinoplanes couchii]GID58110.1 hypothetical protein Aco03nite_065140 [Actinoplanes couchii]